MPEPVRILVPKETPNDDRATVVEWHFSDGARVEAEAVIATLETTKVAFSVTTPAAGYLHQAQAAGDQVPVGGLLAVVVAEPLQGEERARLLQAGNGPAAGPTQRTSRKALQLMARHGLSPADFPGDGPIRVQDVEARVQGGGAPDSSAVPLEQSSAKQAENRYLAESYRHLIPSSVTRAVSVEAVQASLAGAAEGGHGHGHPVSLLELLIFHCGRLLPQYPALNGYYEGGQAWRYPVVNVGFAVNLGRGLKVPVLRDVHPWELPRVAARVRELGMSYLRGELVPADVAEGSFTVSDLSTLAVTHFTPVVNRRQAAILGICAPPPGGATQNLVLAFDHRMADGMEAARFLADLAESAGLADAC